MIAASERTPTSHDLDKALARWHRSRLRRLFAEPRLAKSKALELWCERRGATRFVSTSTFWGDDLEVFYPDRVSMQVDRYGFFEEDLTRAMIEFARPGGVVFDVGAHLGYASLLALRIVGPSGQVHAFEPTPSTFAILARNLAGHENVRLNQLALHSREGSLLLADYGPAFAAFNSLTDEARLEQVDLARATATRYEVSTTSLDRYVAEVGAAPDLIKLDAEGAELEIARGGAEVLTSKRPVLVVEVGDVGESGGQESGELVRHFEELGYRTLEWNGKTFASRPRAARYPHQNLIFVTP